MIIDHNNKWYLEKWNELGPDRYNGAFFYSQEITRNIIPNVRTDRSWITVNIGQVCDHAVFFIHNNYDPSCYEWLKEYDDLVLVCGIRETVEKVSHLGKAIYIPLSVDVEEVQRYRKQVRYGTAFAGRIAKRTMDTVCIPKKVYKIQGLPRDKFLQEMARFEFIYAVGRTAIEAKVLGCKVLPYDSRYPDPDVWKVFDNKEAARMIQERLDDIDGMA